MRQLLVLTQIHRWEITAEAIGNIFTDNAISWTFVHTEDDVWGIKMVL